jgi:hypothetical protein
MDLRAALIEAACSRAPQRLLEREGKEKAIVAIARQMLVVVWHLWHDHELDRHMDTVTLWLERRSTCRTQTCNPIIHSLGDLSNRVFARCVSLRDKLRDFIRPAKRICRAHRVVL